MFRGSLLIFSFVIPVILMVFRNTEFLSSLLGRPLTDEAYISFNLDATSKFRNLRILTFRKNRGNFNTESPLDEDKIIEIIDSENKKENINLIVLNISKTSIGNNLEKYLINLNKKILIISNESIIFNNNFIYREEIVEQSHLTYFNNDIQYGAKYILKRVMDIFFSLIILTLSLPVMLVIAGLIFFKDGNPIIIKQNRVGLHGKQFQMFKFRSMLTNLSNEENYKSIFPPIELCGDNAAMIAMVGLEKFKLKQFNNLDYPAKPRWPLDENAAFLKGAGVQL